MSEIIGKVKCRVCENEKDGFCKVKKCSIKLNKSRHCQAFIMDNAKIKVSVKPETVIKAIKEQEERIKQAIEDRKTEPAPAPDYLQGEKPDVLSKFRSSAPKDEKED